jgi:hypothetical protein
MQDGKTQSGIEDFRLDPRLLLELDAGRGIAAGFQVPASAVF